MNAAQSDGGGAGGSDWRCHLHLIADRYYAVGDGLLAAGNDIQAASYIGIADAARELASADAWSDVSAALHAIGATP